MDRANSELRKNYAIYLVKLGRQKEAYTEIKQALKQEPKDPSMQFFAARVYVLEGMGAEALQAIGNAIALGYSAGEISHEPDLAPLHADRRFQRLVAGHDKN
jgi:predicted Zn-dependent protease